MPVGAGTYLPASHARRAALTASGRSMGASWPQSSTTIGVAFGIAAAISS